MHSDFAQHLLVDFCQGDQTLQLADPPGGRGGGGGGGGVNNVIKSVLFL